MTAVQATAAVRSHWQMPSASCAEAARRVSRAPRLLPIPRPIRNTARIKEKAYTVAPSISESRRVQTTSAPSADIPERAIAGYTAQAPAARSPPPPVGDLVGGSNRAAEAERPSAMAATARSIAEAA